MRFASFILLLLMLALPANPQDIPLVPRKNTVTDTFGVMDVKIEKKIVELAEELRRITSINLAVAILHTTQPVDPKTYGELLYDRWDLGQKKMGLDHGVLILIAIVEHDVKIIAGSGVDYVLTPEIKEKIEINIYPSLVRGEIAEGAYFGAAAITKLILEGRPAYIPEEIGFRTITVAAFALVISAILLSIIFRGNFLTIFGTIVGGLFGFLFFDFPGMFLGAAMGFFLNIGPRERKETEAEKELRKLMEKRGKKE